MRLSALGPRLSRLLADYYLGPDHPMKLRLWSWLRISTGHPLLKMPYCVRGWIALDERDYVQQRILSDGLYEPEVWEALFSFASDSEVLWDIGAHVGTFTVRSMLDSRVAVVHAFEPDPITLRALQLNVDLNRGLGSQCVICNLALGADSGNSILHRGPAQNIGMSSIAYQPSGDAFSVQRTSIDQLVFQEGMHPPTLMKIDVEGSERDLLLGGKQFFQTYTPKAVVIEAEANPDGTLRDPSVVEPLLAAGYEIGPLLRPKGEMWPRENYLAVPAAVGVARVSSFVRKETDTSSLRK